MSPIAPLRAEMTLDTDGTRQQGVDGQPPAGVTRTPFLATAPAGAAVAIIKAGLQLERSQLHLTASATGLQGALLVISQVQRRKLPI